MLPIDHLLGLDEEPHGEWLADHHQKLKLAFEFAHGRTEKEALRRQERLNKASTDTSLPIGSRVFLRNRVLGRNKIQDVWSDVPHKVIARPNPTGNVYVVEPLVGDGPQKTLHRRDLLDSCHLVPDMDNPQPTPSMVPTNQPQPTLSQSKPPSSVTSQENQDLTDVDKDAYDIIFGTPTNDDTPSDSEQPPALDKAGEQPLDPKAFPFVPSKPVKHPPSTAPSTATGSSVSSSTSNSRPTSPSEDCPGSDTPPDTTTTPPPLDESSTTNPALPTEPTTDDPLPIHTEPTPADQSRQSTQAQEAASDTTTDESDGTGEPLLRRSKRLAARRPPVSEEVLADLSRSHLLLMQMLADQ